MFLSPLVLALLPTLILSFPLGPPQSPLQNSGSGEDQKIEPLLPTCSTLTFPSPCKCPKGTSYVSTVTYGVIGANAKDVYDLCGNFFEIEWLGMHPKETAGPTNTIGSTRTDWVRTMLGYYNFTEEVSSTRLCC